MNRCPNGHFTSAADRCDICGAPLDAAAQADDQTGAQAVDAPTEQPDEAADPGLPDVPAPAPPSRWVVEVRVDPDWYAESQSPDPMPPAGPPRSVLLTSRSALVGRPSASRNIHPDVDCSDDSGVSRRHAQLTTDGTRFWVEDLESANGTFVGSSGGPLPKDPVAVGARHELDADDRVYVGAWTRLVVRPATEDEEG